MFYDKHKVFISYRHRNERSYPYDADARYKEALERILSLFCINKSVENNEYDTDLSDEYIKRLIRDEKVSDSSVVIVLCGPETWSRKHVDWEIYAGLRSSINGRSGLVGVLLPNHPNYHSYGYSYNNLPPRLADNVKSGYAKIYKWDYFINHAFDIINEAFNDRINKYYRADNSREQMKYNRCL